MIVRGDAAPPGAFTVEAIPNRRGWCLARFYENPRAYESADGADQKTTGWVYDEYHLELKDTGAVASDIECNFDVYLREAKRLDAKLSPDEVEGKVKDLETDLATTDETAIELYEANLAQESVNAAQDDALIELYEMIGGV